MGQFKRVDPVFNLIKKKKKGQEVEEEVLGKKRLAPHLSRNAARAKLLVDTAEYVLGLGSERAKTYFQLFRQLIQDCFEATQEPSVQAIANFLDSEPLKAVETFLKEYPAPNNIVLEKGHIIAFLVDDVEPTELKSVQQFWADYTDSLMGSNVNNRPCLITGEVKPIATKIEYKVKGVPNTQASGASLVSAYCDSFQSYGLKQAENSPISIDGVEKFSQAIAYLINTDKHRMRVGPLLYLFWGARDFDINTLTDPTLADVQKLLKAAATGKKVQAAAENFYVLTLSGGGGRVIVRDFLQTTIEEVNQNLANWFQWQQLDDFGGQPGKPLGIYQLAAVAYRDAAKELQPRTLTNLSSVALRGGQLPCDLWQKVLTRVRIEGGTGYRQAVLIKLILNSLGIKIMPKLDERMASLTEERHQVAYCCGRLMATFESIQQAALGEVGANVSEKSYAAAASTPSRIFGRLGSGAINHLSTLRKNKPGLAVYFEKRLQEIYDAMPTASYPNSLSLEEQGIFDIGYWQQKAAVKPQS
jgi:CRISPR-associated protein Csd1